MADMTDEIDLPLEDFHAMRDYIHEKSGMYFGDNKAYLLKGRLMRRMEELGIGSFRDYFYRVKYDTSLGEFNRMIELVSTNETSFFRNETQLLSFANEALPLILENKRKKDERKSLRIWSAGCSTGEEPYTLAMMIKDALKDDPGWQVQIFANDISERVLQTARTGEYGQLSMRGVPQDVLTNHFEKSGDRFRIKSDLKAMVRFVHLNLNDVRKFSMYKNLDFIFCRNVIIYFSDEMKKRLFRAFYQCMNPGGYLFLGHSESLHGITKAFRLVYFKGALVYEKGDSPEIADDKAPSEVASFRTKMAGLSTSVVKRTPTPTRITPVGAHAGAQTTGATRAMELLAKLKANNAKQSVAPIRT